MAGQPIDDGQLVLQRIVDDGGSDEIRRRVMDKLKQHEGLKQRVQALVEGSQTLNDPGVLSANRAAVAEQLRAELESTVLQEISRVIWELESEGDIAQLISEKVHQQVCRLRESMPVDQSQRQAALPNGQQQPLAGGLPTFVNPQAQQQQQHHGQTQPAVPLDMQQQQHHHQQQAPLQQQQQVQQNAVHHQPLHKYELEQPWQ